ncbi:hypothetical protein FSP39_019854 [Pinctada imbricata]|uniref:Uncharacterized protein n=1 Tax=Pinctada imbricata TaxID=66713 RepID=A0AA88XTL8_PINIB|nr:hypothetical protein FSP39_019854 [Pinctada imbricata]
MAPKESRTKCIFGTCSHLPHQNSSTLFIFSSLPVQMSSFTKAKMGMVISPLLTMVLWSLCLALPEIAELSIEKQLIRELLEAYKNRGVLGRPVTNYTEIIEIKYGLSLIQILDLDERNQVLSTNVWATYNWKDIYMRWDPQKYGNITKIRVPSDSIWKPDMKLYNYADERREEKRDAYLVIEHDGSVIWIPQAIFKSSCAIDIMHFPFDVQTCKMKFGTWTHDGTLIDLGLYFDVETGFDMTEYVPSNEWDIVSSSAKKNVIVYACCPEPFIDLTFTLEIKRKPAFYNYILILPCILLSSLTLVLFWLPPESPAKMQLGMNIFVAFFVLLLLLAESTPPAASSIPLIGAYYCLNMIMITLSTFLSVIVVNLYFRGSRTRVPRLVKRVLVDCIGSIMCMRDQIDDKSPGVTTVVVDKRKGKQLSNNVNREKNFKYDKVGYFEMQTEESWKGLPNGVANKNSSDSDHNTVSSSSSCSSAIASLENDVKDIRLFLKRIIDRTSEKEAKEKISREWRVVALVLDRLFFFFYLLAIIVSIFTVFEKALFDQDNTIRAITGS